MNIIAYIKKNGISRVFHVIYYYKIDLVLQKIIGRLYKNKKLLNAIVIESHNDFDCNGGAFYDYLIQNEYNKKFKIIWLIKHQIPENLPQNVYAFKLNRPSWMKNYYICRAKFLTADNDVTKKTRDDQVSFYFTHGPISLKNVAGLLTLPETVDYVSCPSEYYAPILARQIGLPYPNNKMLDLGFPFHDIFYRESENELKKVTNKKYKKVFLWMPTFRKGGGYKRNDSTREFPFGVPLIEKKETLDELQVYLAQRESLLIIKIHPMQDPETYKDLKNYDNIIVLDGKTVKKLGIDNYHLIKSADALISDYSSIAYSYLLLNRPMAFTLDDMHEYKLGFAMDNYEDYIVGHKIYTFEDFYAFLRDVLEERDDYRIAREQLMEKLYRYRDGDSCKRIIEFMESLCVE